MVGKAAEIHPRVRIADALGRIYADRMTTTSGGNLSVRTEEGDIWITPAATDKGQLRPEDVVRCRPDGSWEAAHPPSSELPFHQAIYARRHDLRAIIHAHPPAMVAFSIVAQTPDTRVLPQASRICGTVGYAPYAVPGSDALGERIAEAFSEGSNAVIMENHGAVIGGSDMDDAFRRFTTLELCAESIIRARRVGEVIALPPEEIARYDAPRPLLPQWAPERRDADELATRDEIAAFVRRACRQGLMITTYGTVSVRLANDDFLITPTGCDRWRLEAPDLVRIRGGCRETGSSPSRSTRIHRAIYNRHPSVRSIILTQSPNAMAFAITGRAMDTRTIPESFLLLREIALLPFHSHYGDGAEIAAAVSERRPVLLIANDCLLVTGGSLLQAYDRLEVAEFSARSLVDSTALGQVMPIGDEAVAELKRAFGID